MIHILLTILLVNLPIYSNSIELFNSALTLERSGEHKKAIATYYEAIKNSTDKSFLKDCYYRIGASCHKINDWTCVISSLQNWKNTGSRLSISEQFEFRIRTGSAYLKLQSYRDSKNYLEPAVRTFLKKRGLLVRDAKNKELNETKILRLGLWGMDDLAITYQKLGEEIELEDNKKLNKQVELKAMYYVLAQNTYIDLLKQGDLETATKGLYLTALLYENAYKDFKKTKTPKNIKEEKLETEYSKELDNALKPLIEKALIAHKKNIELANSKNFKNEWTNKSEIALKSL